MEHSQAIFLEEHTCMNRRGWRLFKPGMMMLMLLALLPVWSLSGQPVRAQSGEFRVEGTKILNPVGGEFIPDGANVNGIKWGWTPPISSDSTWVNRIKNDWQYNSIRLNICLFSPCPRNASYTAFGDAYDFTRLDAIVNAYTSQGIVVQLELHDWTCGNFNRATSSDMDAANAWWRSVATRYKNNTYVWFNPFNEPGYGNPASIRWRDEHRRIIQMIRDEVGASNIIVLDGTSCGQEAGNWSLDPVNAANSAILTYGNDVKTFNGKTYSNIAFAFHVYDQWAGSTTATDDVTNAQRDARMADFIDRIHAAGHAVFIGETGGYGNQPNGDARTEGTKTAFRVAPGKGVGILGWHYTPGDGFNMTTNGSGHAINSSTAPTNLTWFGQLMWNYSRNQNTSNATTPPRIVLYQAEDGTVGGGSAKKSGRTGETGTGYVDFGGLGSWSEVQVSRSSAGTALLSLRYTNGGTTNRSADVTINDTTVGTVSFAPTGGWTTWQTVTLNVSLNAGTNTVRVTANSSNGGPDLDRFEVQ
jgi:mannan endo-1,4-beta-mannosidase